MSYDLCEIEVAFTKHKYHPHKAMAKNKAKKPNPWKTEKHSFCPETAIPLDQALNIDLS